MVNSLFFHVVKSKISIHQLVFLYFVLVLQLGAGRLMTRSHVTRIDQSARRLTWTFPPLGRENLQLQASGTW